MKAIPNLDFAVVKPTEPSLKVFAGMLRKVYQNLVFVINGNLGFGDGTNSDNVSGSWINTTTPGAANTDFTVNHNLNRLPVGYWIMQKDRAVDIYTGSVAATKTQITLRATVASAVVRLFVICLLFAFGMSAQTTNVTLQVTDSGGQSWNNGSWSVVLASPPGTSPFGPPFNLIAGGGTVPNQSQTGALSGTGSATMTLTQNSAIVPSGSQWKYTVCPQAISSPPTAPPVCFSQFVTITAVTTVTLTPPPVTVQAGATTTAYSDTEVVAFIGQQYFNLTTGVVRFCAAPPTGLCTTWANSGGGAAPLGNNGDLQMKNGAFLAASHINDNGTVLNYSEDSQFRGPNPYIDVRSFGARIVPTNTTPVTLGITAACVATNANVTISSASTFANGDGVVLYGCGTASGMSTPAAPTVTAGLAAAPPGTGFAVNAPAGGATTVCYKYADRDKGQGLTAASAETCVTGQAPGQKSLSITSASITNNTLTFTTAARSPEVLAVGMYFCLFSTTNDAIFAGCNIVATVPSNTTFTASAGNNDTRAGIGATTATGGTMTYWNMNHVVPPTAGTNVWEHIYYAGSTGTETFDGIGLPVNAAITGDASYQVWDDLGSPYTTAPVNPGFIPTSPPSVAVADSLVTTIASGAGTTTLTLTVAPTTSVGSTPIRLEFGQNIKAAFTAANSVFGMIYIPETSLGTGIPITALTDLSGFSNQGVAVNGQLYLVDSLLARGDWNAVRFRGATVTPSFAYSGYTPLNIFGAFPGIVSSSGFFSGFIFQNSGNQYNSFYLNNGSIAALRMDDCAWGGSSGSDYSGVNFIAFGNGTAGSNPAGLVFHNIQGNSNQGNSATPQFHFKNFGEVNIDGFVGAGRGFFFGQNGSGTFVDYNGRLEIQALSTPFFTAYAPASSIVFNLQNVVEDTGVMPIVSTIAGAVFVRMFNVSSPSGSVPIVTGLPIGLIGIASSPTQAGSVNFNTSGDSSGAVYDGIFNGTQSVHTQNAQFILGTDFSLYTTSPQPPPPTCSTISAGPPFVPAGSYNFTYYPLFPNGSNTGRGLGSAPSSTCTANGTSQQITVNLPGLISGASTYLWTYGQNFADINGVHCTNTTTALSWTFQGTNCGFGTPPAFAGGGPAGIGNGTVWGLSGLFGQVTVSSAGQGNGVLALSGNTSGAATFTAPAVAGTSTNAVTMTNTLNGPNGTASNPTYGFSGFGNTGMSAPAGVVTISTANTVEMQFFTASGTNILSLQAAGTGATLTGTGACGTITTQSGGPWAGQATCTGTTGASTFIVTTGFTASHGYSCWANDLTTAANILRQSATATTSCTIAGTVNANDVITFGAIAY